MNPMHVNPIQWQNNVSIARDGCARIFRDGQRQKYPGTFLITGVNGATIPVRSVNGRLKAVYGPSIGSDIFGRGRYATVIQAEVSQRINEQFITGMQRVLDSAARGYGKG